MAQDAGAREVGQRLAEIAAHVGGTLGVSALNLETGERVRFNADQRFPMASTFKVPVALKVLEQVDRGALALDERLAVDQGNLSPGSGELGDADVTVEKSSTVGELLQLMLRNSNNTATDILMKRIGGPAAVDSHVKDLGIAGLAIDRWTAELVADAWGFRLPPPGSRTLRELRKSQGSVSRAKREAARFDFLGDGRDTTTPDAMVALLERMKLGKALGPRSTGLLIEHMEKCRTGARRLKGELPRGTRVAHKTGTFTGFVTNDVGIIWIGRRGTPIVVAVYLKGSTQPLAAQERAIADSALALYRHYGR